jgi:CRP/FNR family transcriptional regulator
MIQEFLTKTQFFQGLSPENIEALAKIAIAQTYQKNEVIFWQGDEGRGFFLILVGRVKVFKLSPEGKEQILHIFGAGEQFAEVPAFDGQCFPASAAAIEPTELLFFPRSAFISLIEKYPSLGMQMLAIFSRKLRHFTKIIENLSFKEVPGRLASYLLYLNNLQRDNPALNLQPNQVKLDITKGQLAALLATIPETLSRVFAKLSQEGLIEIDGAVINLVNFPELKRLSGDLEAD